MNQNMIQLFENAKQINPTDPELLVKLNFK